MERKQIVKAAKLLNDSGLAARKVKLVGASTPELIEDFLSTAETVPREKESALPKEVEDAFNALVDSAKEEPAVVDEAPAKKEEPVVEEKKPEVPSKPVEEKKPEVPSKPVEEKKPKVKAETSEEVGTFEHLAMRISIRDNTKKLAYLVDKCLLDGGTVPEIFAKVAKAAKAQGSKVYSFSAGEIRTHIKGRIKSGWIFDYNEETEYTKLVGYKKVAV